MLFTSKNTFTETSPLVFVPVTGHYSHWCRVTDYEHLTLYQHVPLSPWTSSSWALLSQISARRWDLQSFRASRERWAPRSHTDTQLRLKRGRRHMLAMGQTWRGHRETDRKWNTQRQGEGVFEEHEKLWSFNSFFSSPEVEKHGCVANVKWDTCERSGIGRRKMRWLFFYSPIQ